LCPETFFQGRILSGFFFINPIEILRSNGKNKESRIEREKGKVISHNFLKKVIFRENIFNFCNLFRESIEIQDISFFLRATNNKKRDSKQLSTKQIIHTNKKPVKKLLV